MSDSERNSLDAMLVDGLRRVDIPEPAADFDARVRAALEHGSRPWWSVALVTVRPAMTSALCALCVTFALLKVTAAIPGPTPSRDAHSFEPTGDDAPFRGIGALRHELPAEPPPSVPGAPRRGALRPFRPGGRGSMV